MCRMHSNPTRWSALAALLLVAFAGSLHAEPASDQYAVAAEHYRRGRWRLASAEFLSFLQRYPQHAQAGLARFYRAEALLHAGEHRTAADEFARYLQAPHADYERHARFRLGEAKYLLGDADAEKVLQGFVKQHPDDPLNEFADPYLGNLRLKAQDYRGAEEHFARALQRYPQGHFADSCRLGLAQVYQQLKQPEQARRFFQFLTNSKTPALAAQALLSLGAEQARKQQFDGALQTLAELLERYPKSPQVAEAHYWVGRSLQGQKQWPRAAQHLEAALALAGDAPPAPAAAFAAAEVAAEQQQLPRALELLEKLATRWPKSEWGDDAVQWLVQAAADAKDAKRTTRWAELFEERYPQSSLRSQVLRDWGRSQLQAGDSAAAVETFSKLIRLQQTTPSDWYHLSLAQLGEQQHAAALQSLAHVPAESAAPELAASVALARAAALLGQKDYQAAATPLQKYLQLQPQGAEAARCLSQLGLCYGKLGRWTEADAVHRQLEQRSDAEKKTAGYWETTAFLAEAAYKAGKMTLAKRLFQRLADAGDTPERKAKGLSGLAWLQWQAKDTDSSQTTLDRLLKQHGDSPLAAEAAMLRARAHEQADQPQDALVLYQMVIKRFPKSPHRSAALLAAARLLDEADDDRSAAVLLEQHLAEFPRSDAHGQALFQLAWVANDLRDSGRSDRLFRKVVDEHPSSSFWADAAYRLASRAAQGRRYDEARGLIARILARPDVDSKIRMHTTFLQGQLAANEREWPEVASAMSRVLKSAGGSELELAARYWRGEALFRMRRFPDAGQEFDRIIRQSHGRQEPWLLMAPLRKAQALAHQKRWREALELAQSLRKEHPEFDQLYEVDYLIGRCHGSRAEFAEARNAYRRVVRNANGGETETGSMAQWMIGETYFHQKKYREAIREYHRVLRHPRWQAAALLQAGKCHEMLGQTEQAVRLYDQLLQEHAGSRFEPDAKRRRAAALERARKNQNKR